MYIFISGGVIDEVPEFDFILASEIITTTVGERLSDAGLSKEECTEIEFLERQLPPQPQDSLEHDDWVAAIHNQGTWYCQIINYLY